MDNNEKILEKLSLIEKRLENLEKDVYWLKVFKEKFEANLLENKVFQETKNIESIPVKGINNQETKNIELSPVKEARINVIKDKALPTEEKSKYQEAKVHTISPKEAESKKTNFEMEFGGKWINRIGIAALILAVAFFLKYTFDNNLIGPQGRIFIGVLIGVSMLVSGDLLFKKYRLPSEGLLGGGTAILSFTLFAAFSFYSLINHNIAIVLFILIVLASSFLAIKNDTVALMHISTIAGFLTPFLFSTGEANDIFFLSYLIILNLGIVIISYYKNWKSLFYVAFFASHLCLFIWLAGRYQDMGDAKFIIGFIPTTIIYLEFLTVSILMNLDLNNKRFYTGFDFFLLFFNAIIFYFEGCYMINSISDINFLGIFTIIMAILYLVIFYVLKRVPETKENFLVSLLLVALIFITIAIPVQLDGIVVSLAWAIETLVLAYLYTKTGYKKINIAYYILIGITILSLLLDLISIGLEVEKIPFFNLNSIIYVVSIIILFVVVWIRKEDKGYLNILLIIIFNLLLMVYFIVDSSNIIDKLIEFERSMKEYEKVDNYMYMRALIQSLVILIYSIALIFVGFIKKSKHIRIFSLSLFLVVIFKVFLYDLSSLVGIYRILSFMALGVILIAISFIYQKYKDIILGEL